MAGLKYERLIVKMSLEQKLRLITSGEFYKSSSVGSYEFPVFDIQRQPYGEDCKGVHVTHFPNDFALASAFNPSLVNEVYNAVGEETHAVNSFAYFNCSNDLSAEKFTSDPFILGKYLAEKAGGLKRGGAYVNFEDVPAEDEEDGLAKSKVRDAVLSAGAVTSVIVSGAEQTDVLKKRFKYGDLTFGVVYTVEEALDFLYSGASFLFLAEDISDALVNKLTSLTTAYKAAHAKYVNDTMSESSFARLVRTFKIFNEEIIDKACDDIIGIVYSMKDAQENPQLGYKSLKRGEDAAFDEINHNELATVAAKQSAVLIKNNGVLPVTRATKLAVMGEYAKDVKYQREYYSTRATAEKLAFDAINDYELNTVGFALGYAKGEVGRSDLIDHAVRLCGSSDAVLLYLAAEKGADRLPPEQLDLINILAGRGAKIIAVVASEGNIDLSFADKCAAVLLTFVAGQGGTVAALDIITGEESPSGKLAFPMGRISEAGFTPVYPVGYGLSYTSFEYTNLKANETGVSFTVKNVGNYDGYAVTMLGVKKKNTKSLFAEKQFKGYTKTFVAKGDAVRVKIEFDENTFSQHSEDKGYFVEGGLYTVIIGETPEDEKLSGNLMLREYSEKNSFRNVVEETADDARAVDFSESGLPADVKAARKKLPFSLKLTVALMFAVYVDAVLALFAFANIISDKGIIFYAIIGVIALVVNALVITYICLAARQRHKNKYLHANVVLTDMLDNVEEFTEIAKVRYKQPVVEEQKDEEQEEEEEEGEEPEAEALAATYEVKFDDSVSEDVVCAEKVSYSELCVNLKDFAAKRGINIEIASVRMLLAAIASCKIVFLTSKNAELLPGFVKILNEYYGNETPISASDEWHSLTDLMWSDSGDGGKFVLSTFSNAVYAAHKAREQERVLVIDNVNINNLGSWFCNFLEYANHPTEEYVISFNDETSFKLPNNLTYVLIPQESTLSGLPAEILNASFIVDVMLSQAAVAPEADIKPKILSHEDTLLLLSEAKEAVFVSERIWKRVDLLCKTVNEKEQFAIGNKNTIQMESFTSVLMECGADEAEATTYMFLCKLAYILKNTRTYRQDGGDKAIYTIIEKLFVDEELTKIKRVLTKTAQSVQAEAAQSVANVQAAAEVKAAAQQAVQAEMAAAEAQSAQPEQPAPATAKPEQPAPTTAKPEQPAPAAAQAAQSEAPAKPDGASGEEE